MKSTNSGKNNIGLGAALGWLLSILLGLFALFMVAPINTSVKADIIDDGYKQEVVSDNNIINLVIEELIVSSNSVSVQEGTEVLEEEVIGTDVEEIHEIEDFIRDVRSAIEGDVSEGEVIQKVEYQNGELRVYVDIKGTTADLSVFSLEVLAENDAASITDDILGLDSSMWETVKVIFNEVGETSNTKSDIVYSEYGKYFDNTKLTLYDEYYQYKKEELLYAAKLMISNSYGSENCSVAIEDSTLVINVWHDGIASAVIMIGCGCTEYISGWNTVVQGTATMANSWYDSVKELNVYGVENVEVRILNDLNKDDVLVSILNGNVVYDIINAR